MSTLFSDKLRSHSALQIRRDRSAERLKSIRDDLESSEVINTGDITAFAAGSFARGEAGEGSDLDIFLVTETKEIAQSRLRTFAVIADLIRINKDEQFPEFSNDGEYLRIYLLEDLRTHTGLPDDDGGNYFTARMLMLLEAQPLLHEGRFREQQAQVLDHYFRDGKGKADFKPLFLVNDILRYWRTLCLNYEQTRHDPSRRWRKKNVNLKFSRMVTVFSTVLPLISLPREQLDPRAHLWSLSPLERLATTLDEIGTDKLLNRWNSFLNAYEEFLTWKEASDIETRLGELKALIQRRAVDVSEFLYDCLHMESIPVELQRYLVL